MEDEADSTALPKSQPHPIPKLAKSVDRVTLGSLEAERVGSWISQLGAASKGFLELTKTDLINFLVREHARELTQKEIKAIHSYHYDPVRHLNWIAPRLKGALACGDQALVALLQEELRGIELSVISRAALSVENDGSQAPKPRRKRRSPKNLAEPEEAAESVKPINESP